METWYLIAKGEENQRVAITEDQARAVLKQWKSNVNAELYGRTHDGRDYLKEVLNRNDWRIHKGEPKAYEDNSQKRWICDYGTRHKMTDGGYTDGATGKREWQASRCGCKERFKVTSLEFLSWCQKFQRVEHAHQITEQMQKEFLNLNKS